MCSLSIIGEKNFFLIFSLDDHSHQKKLGLCITSDPPFLFFLYYFKKIVETPYVTIDFVAKTKVDNTSLSFRSKATTFKSVNSKIGYHTKIIGKSYNGSFDNHGCMHCG